MRKKVIEDYPSYEIYDDGRVYSHKRNKFLKLFKEKGISIRQISRLTGVSYYVVQKI